MAYPFRPRLSNAIGPTTVNLSQPMELWDQSDRPTGGGERAASGVPAHYVVRYEPLLYLRLRFLESEWPALLAFLREVDAAGSSWTFRPDQDVVTDLTVYLESPSVANDEEFRHDRDPEYLELLYLDIVLRRTSETAFDVRFGS